MLKKIFLIILSTLTVLTSFAACGDDTYSHESDESELAVSHDSSSSNEISDAESATVSSEISFDESNDSSDINDESSENDNESTVSDEVSDIEEDSKPIEDTSTPDEDTSEPEEDSNPNDTPVNETKVLFDSSNLSNYASPYLPTYAPFSLYDTSLFSETVITSISFPFDSLASGYSVDSDKLYMPIYVIKSDFTSKKSDCTVENGKKVLLDFTGKLNDVKKGDWLTVDNLKIVVGYGETLAFGDTDMAVLPMFLRNDATYSFWNKVFDSKGGNSHSLIFKITGYSTDDNKDESDDGKNYISFLGDSISTYSGWSNNLTYNNSIGGNAIWYPNNNYTGANLLAQDTWWHKVASGLDHEIAVNNSWSGSVVNSAQTYNVRAKNLHNTSNGAKPDIVVVFMGVNDYAAGTAVGSYDGTYKAPANPTNFSEAYGRMIQNILDKYEGVEIYCCTFLPDRKRFSGSVNKQGIDEAEYNDAIRKIAKNMGVNFIDLYKDTGITPDNITDFTVDKLHPNKDGMQKIAYTIIESIR